MIADPMSEATPIGAATVGSVNLLVTAMVPGGRSLKRTFPAGVKVVIGRDPNCHVVLPSPAVSRRHAEILLTETGIRITDSSSAGTRVADRHVHRDTLNQTGDVIELGVGPYRLKIEKKSYKLQSADKRRRAHGLLLERLRLENRRLGAEVTPELRKEVNAALSEISKDESLGIEPAQRAQLVRELADEALGLGPLESLLADPKVSEIMVVDPANIYAERNGTLELTGRRFTDAEAVRSAIERIVTPLGRRIDESSPLVDARLSDGSRVNAVIPPLALRGPCITIRKFPSTRLTMNDLTLKGSLSKQAARFLQRSVSLKKNIIISGGTGSGKTTLLNVLSSSIGEEERVVTIEDAAELQLHQPHVVGLESKPPNLEGQGEFTIRDLLKNALRMRPDRIVVGECRGGEALDMLQAMNTGHEGSMTTTHANSPIQAINRVETLCLMSGIELPLTAIRRQIAESVDLIVQQCRLADGSRRVTEIAEVTGLNPEGTVETRTIFEFDPQLAKHRATGFMPSYLEELTKAYSDGGEAIV